MSQKYFSLFNTIQYGNSTSNSAVVDITERVVTLQNVEKNPYVFYPLDITNGVRADQIANYNFKDPYASWILYLTNEIVDPYYDWYLTDNEFNEFIVKKYGSIQQATQKVAYWQNNWIDQPSLSVQGYLSEISGNAGRIKYWEPSNYNNFNQVTQYSRTKVDWIVTTNQTISYQLSSNVHFSNNELLTINGSSTAQVAQSNGSTLIVQHVFFPQTSGTIVGQESGATAIISSVNYQVSNIPSNEFVYWSPVYYYDMERTKNEGNKTIRVIQNDFVPSYVKNVKNLLSQ